MRCLLCALVCAVLMGCGSAGGIQTADVAGTVTLDGEPLENVEIFFFTDKFEGYGKTDADGHYRLINGAIVGENKVFLKKAFGSSDDSSGKIDTSIPGMDSRQVEALLAAQSNSNKKGKKVGQSIPAEYGDPKTTKLKFPVPDGGTESADFRL